jgi:3-oxochol-4-en-24-oyl-CoA dehydrogenase
VPIGVTQTQLALADAVSRWASRAGTVRTVRAMEAAGGRLSGELAGPASRSEYWAGLARLGIFGIALPERAGGDGGTVTDLAVAVEQLAIALAPGPVLPTLLAGLLIGTAASEPGSDTGGAAAVAARETGADEAAALLGQIAAGHASVAVALTPAGLIAEPTPGGGLRISGTASLVLGAGDVSHLLLGASAGAGGDDARWFTVSASDPAVGVAARESVDFSRALADVSVDGLIVPPQAQLGSLATDTVRDLAAVLAVAEAAGVAAWCTQTAASHARTRQQFGRPIGAFQAVKHLCASMACRAELAAAAAWDAACAASAGDGQLPFAAAAAAAAALDAAVENAKDCVQVLGGIGFTWEHDAHLYLRRAIALRQLAGGSSAWRARCARLALSGTRRHRDGSGFWRDNNEPGADAAREAARMVAGQIAELPPDQQRTGLAGLGYAAPEWPVPYGLAAMPAACLAIDEELAAAGLARPDLGIGGWAVPAILRSGSDAQRKRFAWPTLRGEITWCQLFSEPEAGSDLAALRTSAVRADGGWLLTGQKVWTSLAAQADWAICLARTDPHVPKHKGITFFLVPMDSPGIQIRPLREITGRALFNEVFLDQVFVPADCVVGQLGEGWAIARATLATERVAMVRGPAIGAELEALVAAMSGGGAGADPVLADQLGARLAEALALSAMDERQALAVLAAGGGTPPAVRKLLGVAHRQAVAETALAACGTDGAAADGTAAGPVGQFLLTRCLSIAGGTSQILMSLVAERVLGLPRDEAR